MMSETEPKHPATGFVHSIKRTSFIAHSHCHQDSLSNVSGTGSH